MDYSPYMFQHCFITGGSSGSGLALAILLAKRGAHVSIVARDETKLAHALKQIEARKMTGNLIYNHGVCRLRDGILTKSSNPLPSP